MTEKTREHETEPSARPADPGTPAGHRGAVAGETGVSRGRPGRRSIGERKAAVLELLSGKASVDQLARRYGVLSETVEKWREQALAGMEEVLLRGDAATPRERELEHEVGRLKAALAAISVEHALSMQAVKEWKEASRPTRPARSRR